MPRILLVDERSVYRMGLRSLIETSFPEAELLEASNLLQAFSQIKTEGYVDLVLIDLDLSRFHSLAPLKAACDASAATCWAIISAADTRSFFSPASRRVFTDSYRSTSPTTILWAR